MFSIESPGFRQIPCLRSCSTSSGSAAATFFSECFSKTSETFTANAQLFEKVYFPRLITPISITISGLIRFAVQLALILVIWLWYLSKGLIEPGWALGLLPFLILLMACIGMGMGLVFSSMTAKYRDLRFLLQFGIQLWMFATPVIYPLSIAGEGRGDGCC